MNTVTPETEGFSSERLERISKTMQRYVGERKIAGTVTLIARHGRVVHFETCGMADIENGKFMQSDTYPATPNFRILTYQTLVA
jgi:hypothetical protein